MRLCRKNLHLVDYTTRKQCQDCKRITRRYHNTAFAKRHPDRVNALNAKWAKNNPGKINAKKARRRALHLNAIPKWLTSEQLKEIQDIYLLSKELQWLSLDKLEVDHIIPLNGVLVSGLHVPWNLQILPKSINASKGNRV